MILVVLSTKRLVSLTGHSTKILAQLVTCQNSILLHKKSAVSMEHLDHVFHTIFHNSHTKNLC